MVGKKGQMKSLGAVTIILILIGLLPTILIMVGLSSSGENFKDILETMSGLESKYLEYPNYLWQVVLPYVATVAIIMGLFEKIGIFRGTRKPEVYYLVISLGWAAMLIPTGMLMTIVRYAYSLGVMWGIGAFMIIFGLGSWILTRGWVSRRKTISGSLSGIEKEIKLREQLISDMINRIGLEKDSKKRKQLESELAKLKAEEADLRKRQQEVSEL